MKLIDWQAVKLIPIRVIQLTIAFTMVNSLILLALIKAFLQPLKPLAQRWGQHDPTSQATGKDHDHEEQD